MKIVVLDSYTMNPGDLSWEGLDGLGECAVYERTPPERVVERAAGAEVVLTNKVVLDGAVMARLRAITAARAKTDRLDARLLAQLLRVNLIPAAYVPPERYQRLRDLTRGRARLSYGATLAKNQMQALLARANVHPPLKTLFGPRGRRWLAGLDLGPRLIGIDAPSLDPRGTAGHPAHQAILGSGRIKGAIEWLNLAGLRAGEYELFCGPLKVVGAEAAPCRVLLRR